MRLLLLILGLFLFAGASPSARAQVRLLDSLIYHLDDDPSASEEIRKIGRDAVPALLDALERYKFSFVRYQVTSLLGEIAADDPKVRSTLLLTPRNACFPGVLGVKMLSGSGALTLKRGGAA
jgi:hypothetical protein